MLSIVEIVINLRFPSRSVDLLRFERRHVMACEGQNCIGSGKIGLTDRKGSRILNSVVVPSLKKFVPRVRGSEIFEANLGYIIFLCQPRSLKDLCELGIELSNWAFTCFWDN